MKRLINQLQEKRTWKRKALDDFLKRWSEETKELKEETVCTLFESEFFMCSIDAPYAEKNQITIRSGSQFIYVEGIYEFGKEIEAFDVLKELTNNEINIIIAYINYDKLKEQVKTMLAKEEDMCKKLKQITKRKRVK